MRPINRNTSNHGVENGYLAGNETIYGHLFGRTPAACSGARVVVIGSGLGLSVAKRVVDIAHLRGVDPEFSPPLVAVAEAGQFHFPSHTANLGVSRGEAMRLCGLQVMGGRTDYWGLMAPRPTAERLARWPYPLPVLDQRFAEVERQLGVPEQNPGTGRTLEHEQLGRLQQLVDGCTVRRVYPAPVALDAHGHAWSSLDGLRGESGIAVVPNARVTCLDLEHERIVAVHGVWRGKTFTLRPEIVVVATGAEHALDLLGDVLPQGTPVLPADHLRLDLAGRAAPHPLDPEDLGIADLNIECRGSWGNDSHLHYKEAPAINWAKYMPSGDNLGGTDQVEQLIEIQATVQMHGRLPTKSLVRDGQRIHPELSAPDLRSVIEVSDLMELIAMKMGVEDGRFRLRQVMTNHHLYGVLRTGNGNGLTPGLQLEGASNCFVLPPTSYPDVDDDSHPILSSLVLASFAAEEIANRLWPVAATTHSVQREATALAALRVAS